MNGSTDKLYAYINGEIVGSISYPKIDFEEGRKSWDLEDCPFYLGYCPYTVNYNNSGIFCANGNEFYIKGDVFSTRLYTTSLSTEQVKQNYNLTLKYRDSFKNEAIN